MPKVSKLSALLMTTVVVAGCVGGRTADDAAPMPPIEPTRSAKSRSTPAQDAKLQALLRARDGGPSKTRRPPAAGEGWADIQSRASLELIHSGPDLPLKLDHCTDRRPFANRPRTFWFAVPEKRQALGALPAGTVISFATSNGTILGAASFTVPETESAGDSSASGWAYPVTVRSDASQSGGRCSDVAGQGQLTARVEIPGGSVTTGVFAILD